VADGRGTVPSSVPLTAAAARILSSVAAQLTFSKELFVTHTVPSRVRGPHVFHIPLVVGDTNHLSKALTDARYDGPHRVTHFQPPPRYSRGALSAPSRSPKAGS
jgi:hypothetical protein